MSEFDGGLLQALENIKTADPEAVVKNIFDLYGLIARMEVEDVVSSFQGVAALAEQHNLMDDQNIRRILEAMRLRMYALSPKTNSKNWDLFCSVVRMVNPRSCGHFERLF